MPYSNVREAQASVPGIKNLTPKQKEIWLSVFNAQLKAGKSESDAIAIAYGAARRTVKKSWEGVFAPWAEKDK